MIESQVDTTGRRSWTGEGFAVSSNVLEGVGTTRSVVFPMVYQTLRQAYGAYPIGEMVCLCLKVTVEG